MKKLIFIVVLLFIFGIFPHKLFAQTCITADVNCDGAVNIVDIGLIIDDYGSTNPSNIRADVNGDSEVNIIDIGIAIDNYGRTSATPTPGPTGNQSSFNFVSWSDTESAIDTFAQESNQAKALSPEFAIFNGDAELNFPTGWLAALNGNNNNGMSGKTFVVRGNGDSGSSWSAFNFANVASSIGASNFADAKIPQANQTYSFDYGNSRFLGIDVPGCAKVITQAEITWAEGRIIDAESKGLTHVFIFMHGPIWYMNNHSDCTLPTNLVSLISAHSIVTATFHGHEHLKSVSFFGPSDGRLNTAHNYVQVLTGGTGTDTYPCNSGRLKAGDYCDKYAGFANITVNGRNITIDFYKAGNTTPTKTVSFSK